MAGFILLLYLVGFGLMLIYAPSHPALVGTATLALTLGLRHAFDADHIAAIDNTTRKLRQQGERPMAVGFFFALGHSAVVLAMTVVVAVFTHAIPTISSSAGFVGAAISGTFLWLIGLMNLAALLDTARLARRARGGGCDEAELEQELAAGGLLMRLGLERVLRLVSRSWHMAPTGLLFGLGFETATEVLVFALGVGTAAAGGSILAVLTVPVLFAAGMTTMDTLDGVVMSHAYDWALRRPARKLLYNLTVTSLSVLVALGVGTIQLLHVAHSKLGLHGGVWDWAAGLDFQVLGYAMAGMFVATWLVALVLWRVLDLDAAPLPVPAESAEVA
jgi:high-affinity nickel-transport protein